MSYAYEFTTRGSGDFIIDYAGENLGRHKLVYRGNDDLWHLADADAVATMPVIGITLEVIVSGNKGRIMFRGYVADDTWAWTTGGNAGKIYASTVAGELTQTPPIGAGDVVQTIAVAFFLTGIWFEPTFDFNYSASYIELFMPVVDPDAVIGEHPAVTLTDGVTETIYHQIPIPTDFHSLVDANVIIVPEASGNIRRQVNSTWGKLCASELYNQHSDSIAAGEVAVVINELNCVDISTALTGIAANDLVGISFTRVGGHANDTVDADCFYLGIRFRYI